MNTLLIAPELFASEGGIARILRIYLKALCDLSCTEDRVCFVALNDAVADSSDLRRYTNDRLRGWSTCHRSKRQFIRSTLEFSRGTRVLVCGHVAQLPVAWLARRLNPGLEYVLVAHGIEVWRRFSLLERIALRGTRRIWSVSDFTRRELLRHIHLPPDRAVVVPNALDPFFEASVTDCAPHPAGPQPPPVILTISRLSCADSYKGIDHLIEAMPRIRAAIPEARLRVVGRGDDLSRLQSIASSLNLNGAVEFLGFVSDRDLIQELNTCRLFALPSQKEGFGLVYLEAMAHGKPCLGANEGGAPEVINSDVGVLADYGDVSHLADTCIRALQQNWNSDTIAKHADRFSYRNFRNRLANLLIP